MSKLEFIQKFFIKFNVECIEEFDEETVDIVYSLCLNGFENIPAEITGTCASCIGIYYEFE